VDVGRDASVGQVPDRAIPVVGFEHREVRGEARARGVHEAGAVAQERGLVPPVNGASPFVHCVQSGEAHAHDRRLHFVHPRVAAAVDDHPVLRRPAVLAQRPDGPRHAVVAAQNRPAVAERPEVLGGVEAHGGGMAEGTDTGARVPRAERLGAVLDDPHAGELRPVHDPGHVGRRAVEMSDHGDLRHGVHAGARGGERLGSEEKTARVHVCVDGHRAKLPGGDGRVAAGVRRGQDGRTRLRTKRLHRELERVSATRDQHSVRRADLGRELLLERSILGAQGIPAAAEHPADRHVDLAPLGRRAAGEVVEGHPARAGHGAALPLADVLLRRTNSVAAVATMHSAEPATKSNQPAARPGVRYSIESR
jgi:hypothetical protein